MLLFAAMAASPEVLAQPVPPAEPAPEPPAPSEPLTEAPAADVVYVTPANAAVQPPATEAPQATVRPARPGEGLYGALSLGVAGPFGGSTAAALHGGFGVDLAVGFGFGWFAVGAVGQYGQTALAFPPGVEEGDGTGSLVLAALEARGIVGVGKLVSGWAALGIGFGGGVVEDEPADTEYEANIGASPVLGFGATISLGKGLRLGPTARWWMLQFTKICQARTVFGHTERDCEDSLGDETSPDLAFVGLMLSYSAN